MYDFRPTSFDTNGCVFALACLVSVFVLFAGVKYGTTVAAQEIVESAAPDTTETELRIEELKAKRSMRTEGEIELLQKLEEYEDSLSTRSIGTASVEALATSHQRFIGADLTNMKLYLYEGGYAIATFDILSKGKRGSRWETPTGLYRIETKETDHFSSIGEVHMPYSMQFFGNFFIHGWPYYPDGTPVDPGYSGGCIRLSTNDAEKVFEFAERNTPIFVWEDQESGARNLTVGTVQPPKISAKSFLVADVRTGEVYAEKNADTAFPIASVSKLMVALVANETIHFDRLVTVTTDDRIQTEGTPGSILANETFSVGDLIYPLLMESNNSVAYALARYYGQQNFYDWMNAKARAVGMEHTSYDDASGISENNVASASDIFKLTRYIHNSQSFILNVTRTPERNITAESGRTYNLRNFNHFYGSKEFLGGKTGYTTEARETMTSVFEVPVKNSTTTATVSIVVLGSADRKTDVERLLAWFKANARVE